MKTKKAAGGPPGTDTMTGETLYLSAEGVKRETDDDLIEAALVLLLSENPDPKEKRQLLAKFLFRQMRRALA